MSSKQKGISLINKRELIFSKLQRIYDFISSSSKSNFEAARVRYNQVKTLSDDFRAIQNLILEFNSEVEEGSRIEVNQVEIAFEDLIYASELQYEKLYVKYGSKEINELSSDKSSHEINIPKLKIPPFNGDIGTWRTFYELYLSCIHSSNIPNICKFQYLRSLLQDEALKVIEHFPLTDSNYLLAFQALINRYQNDRLLASHYLSKLLNFKPLTLSNKENLKIFLSAHKDSVDSFQASNIQDKTDFLLFHIAYIHLDKNLQASFDNKFSPQVIPTFNDLINHVEATLKYAELHSASIIPSQEKLQVKPKIYRTLITKVTKNSSATPCVVCSQNHSLYLCNDFKNKTLQERLELVQNHKICFNCLKAHFKSNCHSTSSCKLCGRTHHTLLHDSNRHKVYSSQKTSLTSQVKTSQEFLLGTVQLYVKDSANQLQPVRAVLDSCSQTSIISSDCAQRLGMKVKPHSENVLGVGNIPTSAVGAIKFTTYSRVNPNFSLDVEALVLPKLNHILPTAPLTSTVFDKFKNLKLADPNFCSPGKVDLILGVDIFCEVFKASSKSFIHGKPSAMNTSYGWVIMGKVDTISTSINKVSLLVQHPSLSQVIHQFWEIEEIQPSIINSPQEEFCEEHFRKTFCRNSEGRFIVSLPFKTNISDLGSNREKSLKNFFYLEKRLLKIPSQYSEYIKFMLDYLKQGHMKETQVKSAYVIPQQVVFKETSSSTKLRTVFNASSPDSTGVSLNERLLAGPKLQADLSEIILNFRFHRYALTADLRQMYRQILVSTQDQEKQHIFWRDDPKKPLKEYQLCTVTYGMTPSAFLAQRVLKQLVEDDGNLFPKASHAILHQRYIDDFLTGAATLEEARQLYQDLNSLLAKGGFQLRKWSSNEPLVLSGVPQDHLECPLRLTDNSQVIKLLGLFWDFSTDCFQYQVLDFQGPVTKRRVLSYIARTYDPMGFISPVTFWIKYFIQVLWTNQLDWDSELHGKLLNEWKHFASELHMLQSFKVPRFIPSFTSGQELTGFCDASERGYAAVIYLRVATNDGHKCFLLKSKSKVAPLKPLTIPRLELQAALLLAKLMKSVMLHRPGITETVHLFTDSQIVLGWLRMEPHKLLCYVAQRVKQINELFPYNNWHHVSSSNNMADYSSRGLSPKKFLALEFWLKGPPFLQAKELSFNDKFEVSSKLPDLKKEVLSFVVQANQDNYFVSWTERFSSLEKLKRVFTYVLRFINNTRKQDRKLSSPSFLEQEKSFCQLMRLQQQCDFSEDIARLKKGLSVRKPLHILSPFLKDGLLMVGGRLSNSNLQDKSKHPILLSKKCHLSKLIVEHYHRLSMHSGPNLVQALIQQKYWILGARSLIKKVSRECIRCIRLRAKVIQPPMADLPAPRVKPSRPFSESGTDFAGPFWVKEGRRRNSPRSKGYLCLFICFSTKAVHLEFVSNLTTSAFLAALDRFVARRGCPSHIYSDNGRNYVGASNHLKEVISFLRKEFDPLISAFASRSIEWHFQPPHSPHFGGLHEAAIKSAKRLLIKLIGDEALYFEEYSTIFARIEAMLNSRPLCALSSDPQESLNYLSPGHFLIGSSLISPPEYNLLPELSFQCRWQKLRQTTQAFWHRWSTEYLHTLQVRNKWTKQAENLRVGQLVLICNASHPLQWPVGRVISLFPGPDGVVRVAQIRVGHTNITRAVNKVVPLPLE